MTKRRQDALPGIGGDGPARRVARARRYVDRQLRAQRAMGHLEPVDEGLIGLVLTGADALDRDVLDPDVSSYTLYRGIDVTARILLELRGERRDAGSDIGWDDELEQLKAALRDAAGSRPADDRP